MKSSIESPSTMLSDISPVNVLIADDHPIFSSGLHNAIRRHKYIGSIHEVANGLEALQVMNAHPINVLFLDYQMPIMNGEECLKKVRELYPHVKVIVLSMFDDAQIVLTMIQEGANGYVLKNKIGEVITLAIKTVLKGEKYFDDDIKEELFRLQKKNAPSEDNKKIHGLTEREYSVMKETAIGRCVKDIAERLNIGPETVKHHRKNGMQKMGVKNPVEVTRYFLGSGFMTLEEFLKT